MFSREGSAMSRASPGSATARPPDCRLCRALKTVAPASSTRLFHSPHSSHCPCQRKDTDPHCWQTYFFFTFAIAPALSEHMRNTRENLETERTSVALFASARCCSWTLLGVLAFYPGRTEKCRSEAHTSELQSLMRLPHAVLGWKK